jgi:hypothetical protein
MSHSPVGKPVAIVGNWQVLLAPVANWLGRRSNAMADDFVDRLARRAGIKKVVHCTYRIPAFQNAKPEYAAVNLPRPFKQQIPRARCLLATARWREAAGGHIADDVSALFAMVFALLFGRGNGSGRRPAAPHLAVVADPPRTGRSPFSASHRLQNKAAPAKAQSERQPETRNETC